MACRNNKKRAFLFVSEVLGKHIPVNPHLSLLSGLLLGYRYMQVVYDKAYEELEEVLLAFESGAGYRQAYDECIKSKIALKEEAIFIGFAETATGLAHSFSSLFLNGKFITTSRENVLDIKPIISFEEEHSHATSHRCYSMDLELFNNEKPVILIDDEITTGKTTLNIIEDIQRKFPRKEYTIVSILDWRSEKEQEAYREKERHLNIKINEVSIIKGQVELKDSKEEYPLAFDEYNMYRSAFKPEVIYIYLDDIFKNNVKLSSINSHKEVNRSPYLYETGRFGINLADYEDLDTLCSLSSKRLCSLRKKGRTLCLGSGEFIYIPMKIAALMGEDIYYHSTTKSPVFTFNDENYGAKNGFNFKSLEDESIINYIYNIPLDFYEEVFLFLEREIVKEKLEEIIEIFASCGIGNINIVFFTRKEG